MKKYNIIEMLKSDRDYYRQCKSALNYDCYKSLITYYSNVLMYIDELIARIEEGSK